MILTHLPAPTRDYTRPEPSPPAAPSSSQALVSPGSSVPPYGSSERLHYRPRKLDDYGDGGAPQLVPRLASLGAAKRPCLAHLPPVWSAPHALRPQVGAAGAFPEVAMPQFPRDMGRKDGAKSSSTVATTLTSQGGINYDAILHQGRNRDKLIASEHSALVPKVDKVAGGVRPWPLDGQHCWHTWQPLWPCSLALCTGSVSTPASWLSGCTAFLPVQRSCPEGAPPGPPRWPASVGPAWAAPHACACLQLAERPDPEEAAKAAKETRAALERMVDGKISAAQPKTLPQQPGAAQFIKYTPAQQGPQYNSGASQRIIRMQARPGLGRAAAVQHARLQRRRRAEVHLFHR